jgi:hypothetical protein
MKRIIIPAAAGFALIANAGANLAGPDEERDARKAARSASSAGLRSKSVRAATGSARSNVTRSVSEILSRNRVGNVDARPSVLLKSKGSASQLSSPPPVPTGKQLNAMNETVARRSGTRSSNRPGHASI